MEINAKQAAALMKAKSYEEFSTVLAGFAQVSEEETKELFDKYHGNCSELSDEELEDIVGGAMYDQNGKEVIEYYYQPGVYGCAQKGRLVVKYADGTEKTFCGLSPEEMGCSRQSNAAAYELLWNEYVYYMFFSIEER